MSKLIPKSAIYFVYDGECPICTHAALALRIKKTHGELNLIDARENENHPVIKEIKELELDLDEGMVIYADGRFYHGTESLKFMARYGESRNLFMAICKSLFYSDSLSRLMYPWMRGSRNWLLKRKKVHRIDNLNLTKDPIFKSVFGKHWQDLPPVLQKRYETCPYTEEVTQVTGKLDLTAKAPLRWLSWPMRLAGQIPLRNEIKVPVSVCFHGDRDSKSYHFSRVFNFKNSKPYTFKSRMLQLRGNEVVEVMRFGFSWKMRCLWEEGKVVLQHQGYAFYAFGHFLPLPLTFLIGKGYAEEIPIDNKTFRLKTHVTHPWWGKVFEYTGILEVVH